MTPAERLRALDREATAGEWRVSEKGSVLVQVGEAETRRLDGFMVSAPDAGLASLFFAAEGEADLRAAVTARNVLPELAAVVEDADRAVFLAAEDGLQLNGLRDSLAALDAKLSLSGDES